MLVSTFLPVSMMVLAGLSSATPSDVDVDSAAAALIEKRTFGLLNGIFGGNGGGGGLFGGGGNGYGGYGGGGYGNGYNNNNGGFLCTVTLGILCGGGGTNTVYIPYPYQHGWPYQGWQGSGCGCDGYLYSSRGVGVPQGYPSDWQYYGSNAGWAPPQNWRVPSANWVAPADTAKSFNAAKWWSPSKQAQKWASPPQQHPSWWADTDATSDASRNATTPDTAPSSPEAKVDIPATDPTVPAGHRRSTSKRAFQA
ncbi:hypothetical protein RQP46_010444 [Phenoliferia psychrophenolica]